MQKRNGPRAPESYDAPEKRSLDKKAERKDNSLTLRISEVTVTEGLQKEAVKKNIEQQVKRLRSCLPKALQNTKITIKLTIEAGGMVGKAEIVSGGIQDTAVLDCLRRAILGWKFTAAGKETRTEIIVQTAS